MASAEHLIVKVIEARNLAPMDIGGTSDPYCKLKYGKQQFKTEIISSTLNPKWDQEFKMLAPNATNKLYIELWDHDTFSSDDFLGEIELDLQGYADGNPHDVWIPVTKEPKKPTAAKGELRLEIEFAGLAKPSTGGRSSSTPITAVYDIGVQIGRGGFAVVYEGKRKDTGQSVAIKKISKEAQNSDQEAMAFLNALNREIDIMSKLKHPNIIELIDVFDTPTDLYIVMELVTGGELFEKIQQKGWYTEYDAADVVKQILLAIQFMHSHGFAHRDLKPENLLCAGASKEHPELIKVADFGLAKEFSKESLTTVVGSPLYVAPEVLTSDSHDSSVDLWSIGIITYILLCGFPPFFSDVQSELFDQIIEAKVNFPSPEWDPISDDAKDFVKSLLVNVPSKRMSVDNALKHQWIVSHERQNPSAFKKQISFASFRDSARALRKNNP